MKKLIAALAIVFAFSTAAWAQPTFNFSSATPCLGDTFCVDVTVKDFTDISSLKFPMHWDTAIMKFASVKDFNLNALDASDFDVSRVSEGLIFLDWQLSEDCKNSLDKTDGSQIFQLCFVSKGSYGSTTELKITDDVNILKNGDIEPIIVIRPTASLLDPCPNIYLKQEPGIISTCVRPLHLYSGKATGNVGDLVCTDVFVTGFDGLTSLQLTIEYDSTILKYASIVLTEKLRNLGKESFATPEGPGFKEGRVTMSWGWADPNVPSITLKDSTVIFQLCHTIIGECEENSAITFSSNPTKLEAINVVQDTEYLIPIVVHPGSVQVGKCAPTGLQVFADCGEPVNLNDEVCVKVTAQGLTDITQLEYLMSFNPNILKFDRVQALATGIPFFSNSNFNKNNVLNGILGLKWIASTFPANVPDGTTLYEVCFDVVGLGGDAPVSFDPNNAVVIRRTGNVNIGLAPNNCKVEVIQPDGIQIEIGDSFGAPGDTVCVDYRVNRFVDIIELDFSSSWEPANLKFIEIKNIALAGLTKDSFLLDGTESGVFSLEWQSAVPTTKEDGELLFEACFEVVGTPPGDFGGENCTPIDIIGFPTVPIAVDSKSNGQDIGITASAGEFCVINPVGYYLLVDNADVYREEEVCVDFRVSGFDDVLTTDFIVSWDPTALTFSKPIYTDALSGEVINTASANVGKLSFSWISPTEDGVTLPDSASLFKLCFIPIGEVNECIDLDIDIDPFPSARTSNGLGSVFPRGGEICIKDRLVITSSSITPVTCFNASDGSISLEVQGGQGNIFYYWESSPRQFLSKARNLPQGQVVVTIFDESNPPLFLKDTFDIPMTAILPFADAGSDKVLGCRPPVVRLAGNGTKGTDFSYRWTTTGGELPGRTDDTVTIASAPGNYVLTVLNKVTSCAVSDTVMVFPPDVPVANAGDMQFFSCLADTVRLNGSLSSPADSITYLWTGLNGGIIMPGDENKVRPIALSKGTYALEVKNSVNACTAVDTVIVEEATEIPDAKAGKDVELSCTGTSITLDGGSSTNLRPVIYSWFGPSGNQIATGNRVEVNAVGAYMLVVQEEGSGCLARDTVQVLPSKSYPVIEAGADTIISCTTSQPRLNPSIANTTDFQLKWVLAQGATLETGGDTIRMPKALSAGQYILQVTDRASSCISSDTLVVTEDIRKPVVEAGTTATLSCRTPEHTLQGTASSPNGAFTSKWQLNGQTLVVDSLNWKVGTSGTYVLTVTDKKNGCTVLDSVVINSIIDTPKVTVNTVNATISCTNRQLTLNATVAPAGSNYTINWITSGGQIVSGATTLAPVVSAPGIYQVAAINPLNGCIGQANVPVFSDTLRPIARAGADITLTCTDSTGVLNGSGSASGAKYAYTWTGLGGNPAPAPATSAQPKVVKGGGYVLQVRDTVNGCIAFDTVQVQMDTLTPAVAIATPVKLTCSVLEVSLDGSGSEQGALFTAQWAGLNGQSVNTTNNAYLAKVTAKGSYQLSVKNSRTGCVGSKTIEVLEDRIAPDAVVQPTLQIPCQGAVRSLDGSSSSKGATYSYLWRTLNGRGTITDETSLAPKINTPGVYGLQVTNTQNGCTDTASVVVIVDPALAQSLAQAGADQVTCTEDVQLTANQPAGTTGVWASKSGGSVESPSEFLTEAFGLRPGQNIFVWTLSKAECPNYSADSVVVFREVAPSANNDELVIEAIQRSGSVNVAQNDQQPFANGFVLSIAQNPKLGRVDSLRNGVVFFGVPPRIYGKDEFRYAICSKSCPELCDTAIVKVDIKYDPNLPQQPVANAITPNGDGANDELRFELLENGDPSIFPDNEIIIFNRWGDIVYQAKPYNNDWKGINAAGKELPHGTYYYLLRLDISKGLIIQGDVTILK